MIADIIFSSVQFKMRYCVMTNPRQDFADRRTVIECHYIIMQGQQPLNKYRICIIFALNRGLCMGLGIQKP